MSTTSLLPAYHNLALENMRQQKDDFFITLTNIVAEYKGKQIDKKKFTETLDAAIFARTKIKTKTSIEAGPVNAAIQSAQYDQAHIFWPEFYQEFKEWQDLMIRPLNGTTGYIDTVNGKVGGAFSKAENPMFLWSDIFTLPADEIAAIILHEVGHAYTFCFYLGQLAVSNIVISQAVRAACGTNDLAKRKVILNQATKYLSIEDRIRADDLAGSPIMDSETGVEALLVNAFRERTKSATGTDLYDYRSCEQLADQFAVRYGAGAALARGVAKFEEVAVFPQTRWMKFMLTAVKIMWEVVAGISTMGITFAIGLIWCSTMQMTGKDYDDHQYRVRLIKQQLIDRIRSMKLTRVETEDLIRDIEETAKLELTIKQDTYGLAYRLAMIISPKRKREFRNQELQKLLEDMLFNPLYVTNAKLKLMGA